MTTNIPDSPPLPTDETTAPTTTIPAQLGAELDLDSDPDSEDNITMEDVTTAKPFAEHQRLQQDMDVDTPDTPENSLMSEIPEDPNYITPLPDFSDPVRPLPTAINPFGANTALSSSMPIPISLEVSLNIRSVSDAQAQKLGEYIDERLLTVQKGFVKYLSAREEDNVHEGMEWKDLAAGIADVVEFLWYAMVMQKGVPVIYHTNILLDSVVAVVLKKHSSSILQQVSGVVKVAPNFVVESGSTPLALPDNLETTPYVSYLIKIMGDLIDYIVKYDLSSFANWILLLRLVAKIDNIISVLIDYSTLKFGANTARHIVSTTEKVRMASIVQRTKIVVVELFDHFTRQMSADELSHYRQAVETFQTCVGEVYEGLVDRTSA